MAKKTLNVAMIGGGFMGKAHSNAWLKVNKFFDTDFDVNLKVIVGKSSPLEAFAKRWGYEEVSYDWSGYRYRRYRRAHVRTHGDGGGGG